MKCNLPINSLSVVKALVTHQGHTNKLMLPATGEGGKKRQRVEPLVQTSLPLTIAAPPVVRTTTESSLSDGNREPTPAVKVSRTPHHEPNQNLEESMPLQRNTSNDTQFQYSTQNGWCIKEDPNRKLFLLTLKDEVEKSKNQGEKKKVVFISYAWIFVNTPSKEPNYILILDPTARTDILSSLS